MSYIVAELYEALIAAGGLLSGFCSMTVNHAMSLIYCRSFCLHPDRQAFPPVLIQQAQQPQRSPLLRSGTHEVVAPNLVRSLRPESHTGAVVQPQPTPGLLFLRHFQPLAPADLLYSILAYRPPRTPSVAAGCRTGNWKTVAPCALNTVAAAVTPNPSYDANTTCATTGAEQSRVA